MADQQAILELVVEQRRASAALEKMADKIDKISTNTQRVRQTTDRWGGTVGQVMSKIVKFNVVLGAAKRVFSLVARAVSQTVGRFAEFEKAIAEVSTLVETSTFAIEGISKASREFASTFGTGEVEQAKAFYQAISAGATDAATATAVVSQANKLAVGGVTDVATATKGLTAIMNAFGLSQDQMADASDSLFAAMKVGVTTIPQLAENIGTVSGVASAAGVKFDEMNAALAAITKITPNTARASTQLAAVINTFIKPQEKAAELSKKLGVELNTTTLRTLGLRGALEKLQRATGGSADALGLLFTNKRALRGVLALLNNDMQQFNVSLDAQATRAGLSEVALEKMMDTLVKQSERASESFNTLLSRLGEGTSQFLDLKDAVRGTANILDDLNRIAEAGRLGDVLGDKKGFFFSPGAIVLQAKSVLDLKDNIQKVGQELKAQEDAKRKDAEATRKQREEVEALRKKNIETFGTITDIIKRVRQESAGDITFEAGLAITGSPTAGPDIQRQRADILRQVELSQRRVAEGAKRFNQQEVTDINKILDAQHQRLDNIEQLREDVAAAQKRLKGFAGDSAKFEGARRNALVKAQEALADSERALQREEAAFLAGEAAIKRQAKARDDLAAATDRQVARQKAGILTTIEAAKRRTTRGPREDLPTDRDALIAQQAALNQELNQTDASISQNIASLQKFADLKRKLTPEEILAASELKQNLQTELTLRDQIISKIQQTKQASKELTEAEQAQIQVARMLASGIGNAFSQALFAGKNAAEVLKRAFASLAQQIISQLIQGALLKLASALLGLPIGIGGILGAFGLNKGGVVPKVQQFAAGGIVKGGRTGRDSVPILATPGERIITASDNRRLESGQAVLGQPHAIQSASPAATHVTVNAPMVTQMGLPPEGAVLQRHFRDSIERAGKTAERRRGGRSKIIGRRF